jgi:peptidoglycan/xylan/chitin deacetylase (PgdA/CDA1 family)
VRAILTYHSIDDSGSAISVSPAAWRTHAAWLQSGRVRVTTIGELMSMPDTADAVAVTFDDAFANFATEVWPLVDGLPVTLFVVTDHTGRSNAWRGRETPGIPTLPLLDWPALGRLAEHGVTLGAHTRTHADLTTVDDAALEDEMTGAIDRLRTETGVTAEVFAYPYGRVDRRVSAAAARSFRWACTTELRALGSHDLPCELPRLDMYYFQQPGLLESWNSPSFHLYVAGRRALRRGRALATGLFAGVRE